MHLLQPSAANRYHVANSASMEQVFNCSFNIQPSMGMIGITSKACACRERRYRRSLGIFSAKHIVTRRTETLEAIVHHRRVLTATTSTAEPSPQKDVTKALVLTAIIAVRRQAGDRSANREQMKCDWWALCRNDIPNLSIGCYARAHSHTDQSPNRRKSSRRRITYGFEIRFKYIQSNKYTIVTMRQGNK